MFGKNKQAHAAYAKEAEKHTNKAREEGRKVAAYRKSLKSGKSDDPQADKYMIRRHEENQRIAEANARDFQNMAKQSRRWF